MEDSLGRNELLTLRCTIETEVKVKVPGTFKADSRKTRSKAGTRNSSISKIESASQGKGERKPSVFGRSPKGTSARGYQYYTVRGD